MSAIDVEKLLGKIDWEAFELTSKHSLDVQGWGGHPEFFMRMVQASHPWLIVEVGTWKGKSALAMADALCRNGWGASKVICVDTWLGATEFIGKDDADPKRGLMRLFGWPQVYYQFLANVNFSGHRHRVFPFPQTSANAARFLNAKSVRAELVYIDGSHEYGDVKQDLENYFNGVLAPDGIIFGDDYCDHWSGVKFAVDEFAALHPERRLQTFRFENGPGEPPSDYWVLSKGGVEL